MHMKRLLMLCILASVFCIAVQAQAVGLVSLKHVDPGMFSLYYEGDEFYLSTQPAYKDVRTASINQEIADILYLDQTYPLFRNEHLNNVVAAYIGKKFQDLLRIRNEDYAEKAKNDDFRDWHIRGRYLLFDSGVDCQTIVFTTYYLTGAMHGNQHFTVFNISKKNGKQLGLKDMFGSPKKALQLMSAYAKKQLAGKFNQDEIVQELMEKGIAPLEKNYSTVFPVQDGLVVIFGQYQLGSFASGIQYVNIPLSELKGAAPKSSVWKQTK